MELICKITDEDIGEKFTNMENPKLRLAARGIVVGSVYSTKFIILRDAKILEKYLENKKA